MFGGAAGQGTRHAGGAGMRMKSDRGKTKWNRRDFACAESRLTFGLGRSNLLGVRVFRGPV